jgi:hypothetical protein
MPCPSISSRGLTSVTSSSAGFASTGMIIMSGGESTSPSVAGFGRLLGL